MGIDRFAGLSVAAAIGARRNEKNRSIRRAWQGGAIFTGIECSHWRSERLRDSVLVIVRVVVQWRVVMEHAVPVHLLM